MRTLTIMGDSWGTLLLDSIKDELAERGLAGRVLVLQTSIPGSTADFWANNEWGSLDLVKQIVALDPNPIVYISLGGNDLVGQYATLGDAVFTEIEADLRFIVDELVTTRPNVVIILAGYDVLNFDKSAFCLLFSDLVFGSTLPEVVNPLFLEIGDVQATLDADYSQVVYANAWGALQGTPGLPDTASWSPDRFFPDDDLDCLHLNDQGYSVYTNAVFDILLPRQVVRVSDE
ncbi:MAG: SGNH/GDSL hydrolase family protein [Chloroflexota bacterium]